MLFDSRKRAKVKSFAFNLDSADIPALYEKQKVNAL
jgi:hypothetical protein